MSNDSYEWFDIPAGLGRSMASLLGLSKIPIVELDDSHRPLILAHLLALSPEDRRLRFSHSLSDSGIAKYLDGIDFSTDSMFGIFGRDSELLGVVHLGVLNQKPDGTPCEEGEDCPKAAELGISLLAQARGHGLGTLLFQRALKRARNEGVELLFIHTLMENQPMRRIAQKLNMQISNAGGETEAFLQINPASTTSKIREYLDEHLADFDLMFKAQLNQFKRWAEEL